MRQILVATDFSEHSNRAVRRAGLLARELEARLILLHVVNDDRLENSIAVETAAAQKLLDATIVSELRDVPCEAKVVHGAPFDRIAKVATASAAELIVMGAHRKQILRDVFVSTSMERVIRLRVGPVLTVKTEPTGPYLSGLVAVDLSEDSRHVLQTVRALGVLPRSQVVAVHAFEVIARSKMSYASVPREVIHQYVAKVAKALKVKLANFLDTLGGDREHYTIRVKEGRAANVIIDVSKTEQVDMVVMGSHGRAGIRRVLLGSVTEEVMQSLDRDILVVPTTPRNA